MPTRFSRLERLLDYWEPQLRRAFMAAVYRMRAGAQLDEIVRMLEARRVEDAIRAVGLNPAQLRGVQTTIERAFEAVGNATATATPVVIQDGLRLQFQFDVRNPNAERWLSENSSRLVREIIDDQRILIREQLVAGLERGANPRTVALDLIGRVNALTGRRENGIIGLTSSQGRWVNNYANDLASENPLAALSRSLRDQRFDPTVRKYAERGEPIPADLRNKMVDTYTNRALRYRAETIARVEMLRSLHAAQEVAVDQAISEGIDPTDVSYVWRTARDSRVRDAHQVMDGQTVRYGEMFTDGDGNQLAYPGDPGAPPETTINCRCVRELMIDYLAGIE